jgi:predicted ATPase
MKHIKDELLINKFTIKSDEELKLNKLQKTNDYPFSIPIIKYFKKIVFKKPVTFLIGENGTGKSTLIEAFANCCGFNPEGGSKYFTFETRDTDSKFYKFLHLEKSLDFKISDGYFLRSEALYNLATVVENSRGWENSGDYGEKSLHDQSHGESILSLLMNRIIKRGFYIFDEPEVGLSAKSLFAMLSIINDLVNVKSQFIICTHSPILLAYPNSEIYEIKNDKLELVQYEDTDCYALHKYFLMNYKEMLRKLEIEK